MAGTVTVVALQPIRSGDRTYRPEESFPIDSAAAKALVAKGYARIAPAPKPSKPETKPETPADDKAETPPKGE
jgi:hypothetical protein